MYALIAAEGVDFGIGLVPDVFLGAVAAVLWACEWKPGRFEGARSMVGPPAGVLHKSL
jgi:hypothetical protein